MTIHGASAFKLVRNMTLEDTLETCNSWSWIVAVISDSIDKLQIVGGYGNGEAGKRD